MRKLCRTESKENVAESFVIFHLLQSMSLWLLANCNSVPMMKNAMLLREKDTREPIEFTKLNTLNGYDRIIGSNQKQLSPQ